MVLYSCERKEHVAVKSSTISEPVSKALNSLDPEPYRLPGPQNLSNDSLLDGCLGFLGHYFTYCWGLGRPYTGPIQWACAGQVPKP